MLVTPTSSARCSVQKPLDGDQLSSLETDLKIPTTCRCARNDRAPGGMTPGGNGFDVSGMIWAKFQRVFSQMLESKTAAILKAGTYSAFASPAAAAVAAGAELAAAGLVVKLRYEREGESRHGNLH